MPEEEQIRPADSSKNPDLGERNPPLRSADLNPAARRPIAIPRGGLEEGSAESSETESIGDAESSCDWRGGEGNKH